MASLPIETWVRFLVWLIIGLTIYFVYSRHRSEFGRSPRESVPVANTTVGPPPAGG
jgi:hypothetical protein